MKIGYRVFFSGRVQGVGFRYTTQRAASGFSVTGYVRNLEDGRVELLAEGEKGELDRFIGEIRQRMEDYIESLTIDSTDATDHYREFTIRHG